ncbi:MAG: chromosome segregation protein SMC [Verrucomicrobiota bacterium]
MFLKSLEMVGFKSFAGRTVVNFHKGMTSIVGPNGCGKSNILDAIRWVLGEQSAKALRGGSMQDVIFNGTDMRKSVGMAEVSLTFADCEKELGTEYHEVRITRRVFRDDQCEYELNKTPCRLKDIQQLFMDTGIGRTAYSIMEQGKIDALLSSKPEDRRMVFEEAAGITKFKSQKKEVLRKLEYTETNLLRVTDIIREVNRQIGSLQRQAAKARRYKEASEQLKNLDTRWAAHQFKHLQSSVQESEEKVAAFQMELTGLQATLDEKEGNLRQQRVELENIEDQIRSSEQQRALLESETTQAQQRIGFHQQRLSELEQLIERNRMEVASNEEKIRFQQEQLEMFRVDLTQLTQEIANLTGKLAQEQGVWQERKNALVAHTKEREKLDAEAIANAKQIESNRDRIAHLESQQRGHLLRVEKLNDDEKNWTKHHEELLHEINDVAEHLRQCEEESKKADQALEQKEISWENINAEFKNAREAFEKIQQERAAVLARKQALEQLAQSQEGYSGATQALLEQKRQGVMGTLLDFIEVRAGYEKAVELCLGLACEAVIVQNTETLDALTQTLQDKGNLVIAPISALKILSTSPSHRSEAAIHFVSPQPVVAEWIRPLLSDYYIVDDFASAQRLQGELPGIHIATRDGEFLHATGWQLRGTAAHAHQSILTRNNELNQLIAEAHNLEKKFEDASQTMENARARGEEAETELAEARQQKQRGAAERDSAQYSVELHQKREEEWKLKLQTIQQEKNLLQEQDQSGLEEQKRLSQEIENLQNQNQQHVKRIEELAALIANLTLSADEQGQIVMDARVRSAAAEQRRESLQKQEMPLQQRLQELKDLLKLRGEEIVAYQQKIEESRAEISSAEQIISNSAQRMQDIRQIVDQFSEQRREKHADLAKDESEIKIERRKAMETQTQCGKEEVSLAEKRMRRDALVERVRHSYQVQLTETAFEEKEEDWAQIETQVHELKEKLDRMGPVNLDAITEFEELEQRQKFLQQQEQDLIKAKTQLADAIRKIDETTKVMFAETFAKIQTNFNEVFVDLFGGGRAAIALMDEQNLLESGIEIIAKPPGKQLQNISLLSGGEKTLTAVALLFAIYMVKPSPFCVLDEMDAPLDDSNIARFIHMLQRFVKQSQFIVITHNKRTIAAADVIYGITMEEHGVSKVISVKLTRNEEDPLFDEEQGGGARRSRLQETTLTS